MDTPPTYSYVCTTATFVRYHPEGRGSYDFLDKFYIKNLQVKTEILSKFEFCLVFSFNHSMQMVHILVHRIIVHHFLPVEYGWVLHQVYFV